MGVRALGGPVEELDLPVPRPLGADEVLVEVLAAGVGPWDELVRTGAWPVSSARPLALGVAVAGTVAAAGSDVRDVRDGDAVLALAAPLRDQGTWAERVVVPRDSLAVKPAGVGWAAAATLPVAALTAAQALDAVGPLRGASVLVHGAGGVTGGLVVELAELRGGTVLAVSGPTSGARLLNRGASHALDRHDPDWPRRLRHLTGGRGATVTVNLVRGAGGSVIGLTATGGRFLTLTGDPPPAERGISVRDFTVHADGDVLHDVATHLDRGEIHVDVGPAHRLQDAARALERARHGGGVATTLALPPRQAAVARPPWVAR